MGTEESNVEATEEAIPANNTDPIEDKIESTAEVTDNGNQTVISEVAIADSNGNFATDNNENITDLKSAVNVEPMEVSEVDASKVEVVENGIDDDKKDESDLPYKEAQWSPANKEGK